MTILPQICLYNYDKEELIEFWKSPASESGSSNLLAKGHFNVERQGMFAQFDSYLWKN